ncbi:MAG TPA: hypothetical protein VK836_13295, partial [Streptosporangiaceae bacterium]|nr:hypothetical protein [Streptosporangiaceae bacterium]
MTAASAAPDRVTHRDPDRDRQPRSRAGSEHADAQRGEQEDADDHANQADQQGQRAARAAAPAWRASLAAGECQDDQADRERDDARHGRPVYASRRRRAPGQRGHHRDCGHRLGRLAG